MRRVLISLLLYVSPLIALAQTASYSVPFSFNITTASRTSAGVYALDGTLIRTLWNNVDYKAGTYDKTWDGMDDEGTPAVSTKYKIIVQTNQVKYEWEGARIGNTSKDLVGGNKHRAYRYPSGMVITGGNAYYCTSFNEGTSSLYKFALNDKQVIKRILSMSGHQISATAVTTDGKLVYWAGFDSWGEGEWPAFIVATKVSNDSENSFKTGRSVTMSQGRTYKSAIAIDRESKITGIAVMKNANYLFVAHSSKNEIRVLDKLTGERIQTIKTASPGSLLMDRSDNYLWVINKEHTIQKFPVNKNGTLGKVVLTLSGAIDPLAFDLSPDNTTIVVADGNKGNEKVRAFSTSSGKALWTMGSGNYETDPNVRNDKFYFVNRNSAQGSFKTLVAFEPNGSFWIGDPGNYRMQHYAADRTFIDRIMYLGQSYNVAVDKNNPTKVFDEYLEFKIDYSKPLAANNGSWELVRNYRAALKTNSFGKDEMRDIFKSVVTLSNGRTYATVQKKDKNNIVELPEKAPMRFTGIEFAKGQSVLIMKDGSLRTYTNRREPKLASFYTQDLKGFDANHNPIWSAKHVLSEIPVKRSDPQDYNQNRNGQSTKSGLLISFMKGASDEDTGYHLGAIKIGQDKWLWKTSKATSKSYKGDFPSDGSFDIGNGVVPHGAGAGVFVVDNDIFWNYTGEFWKNSQTNYWNHFSDIGLMVGQFGTWGEAGGRGALGMAGNAFSGEVVKVGADIYVYQNDENQHSGIHRWRISGLNTIKQITVPVSLSYSGKGLLGRYYNGQGLDNTALMGTKVDSTVNFNWVRDQPAGSLIVKGEHYSMSWSGFVTPLFAESYTFYTKSNDGIRLWVDGNLLIDHWKNSGSAKEEHGTIALKKGRRYTLRLEYLQDKGNTLSLLWSSASQKKEVIPAKQLIPAEPEDPSKGINLMENLADEGVLQDGLYGWHRDPANQDNTAYYEKWWSVNTGVKSFKNPDVAINYRQPNNTAYTVTRNLGEVDASIASWSLSGNINYEKNYENTTGGGTYVDVLDDQDRIIARVYPYLSSNKTTSFILNDSKHIIFKRNNSDELREVMGQYQPIEITGNAKGVTVKYASFDPVAAPVFDPKSNWRKPKTFRLYFFTKDKNSGRNISVEGLRFVTQKKNDPTAAMKAQSIDFLITGAHHYGETLALSAKASSGLPVTFRLKSGPAVLSGTLLTLTGTGTVVVEANQKGNAGYYAAATVSQSFTVIKAAQSITFEKIPQKKASDPAFHLSAVATSGLPVGFRILSGPVTISGSTITLTGSGTVLLEAFQNGDEHYAAAAVRQSFIAEPASYTATKLNQIIDFPAITSPAEGEIDLAASSSSGLPVGYRVQSGPATLAGSKVILTGVGTVVVEAFQSGDEHYNAATVVERILRPPFDFKIYPNPASTSTTLEYRLEKSSEVSLEIVNTQGRTMKRLLIGYQEAGVVNSYRVDTRGLPPGVYTVRFLSSTHQTSKKLLIVNE